MTPHIHNDTRDALQRRPRTISALLESPFFTEGSWNFDAPLPIAGNALALKDLEEAERIIIEDFDVDATFFADPTPHWWIEWNAGFLGLLGTLYRDPSNPHRLDSQSPFLLVHRVRNSAFYGPELIPLARRILAHSLLWHTLND